MRLKTFKNPLTSQIMRKYTAVLAPVTILNVVVSIDQGGIVYILLLE